MKYESKFTFFKIKLPQCTWTVLIPQYVNCPITDVWEWGTLAERSPLILIPD